MTDYSNLLPRLQNAADAIVRGRGSAKDRLASAYLDYVFPLTTKEFPPGHQTAWEELLEAMRRVADEENGSARASIAAMSDDDVQRYSELIVRICNAIKIGV